MGLINMKWFKHETNANADAKLRRVRMKYGMEGYGLYWYCLELIGATVEPHNLTFELEHDAEIIADDTGIHYERVQEMMAYMINLGLFESSITDEKMLITCIKMLVRADEYTKKILRNSTESSNVRTLSRQTPDKVPSNRKNRKKEEKDISRFTPPTLKEVNQYITEKGYSQINGEQFINHYEAADWFRGKTKIKDWKACLRTWNKNTDTSKESYGHGGI